MTSQSQKKDVVVIGLGNVLLSDEGIGVHILRRLSGEQFTAEHAETAEKENKINSACSATSAVKKNVDFIEAGSAGLSLLHIIANRKKAVIIDCAQMGAEPGTMKRFTPDEVQSVKQLSNFSMHEQDILQVINLSKQLGECPQKIVFFGIQPESLEPSQKPTKTLSGRIETYISEVCKELD